MGTPEAVGEGITSHKGASVLSIGAKVVKARKARNDGRAHRQVQQHVSPVAVSTCAVPIDRAVISVAGWPGR